MEAKRKEDGLPLFLLFKVVVFPDHLEAGGYAVVQQTRVNSVLWFNLGPDPITGKNTFIRARVPKMDKKFALEPITIKRVEEKDNGEE